MKRSVLHIYKDYYPPVLGGIEKNMNVLCEGMRDEFDIRVLVASAKRKTETEEINGIEVVKAGTLLRFSSAPISLCFPNLLKQLDADILHFHLPNPTAVVSYFLSEPKGKVIVTYHSDIVRQYWAMKIYGNVLSRFLYRADRILATSPYYILSSRYLREVREKCVAVPLGIDVDFFEPDDNTIADAAKIKARHDRSIVIFVGRLRYYKGLHFLIEAMGSVDAKLLIIGEGPERKRLEKLCGELGVGKKVEFCGELDDDALKVHLHAADVFCLPAHLRSEAYGICQIDAMACGLPVVSTALDTGVPYVNRHNQTGLIVPPASPSHLSGALNKILSDRELRERLGACAKKSAREKFNHHLMIDRVKRAYDSLFD